MHDWDMRKMVDLHSVGHISYSGAPILELIGHENNFMASFHKALCQLICMCLYPSKLWKGKICTYQYGIFASFLYWIVTKSLIWISIGKHGWILISQMKLHMGAQLVIVIILFWFFGWPKALFNIFIFPKFLNWTHFFWLFFILHFIHFLDKVVNIYQKIGKLIGLKGINW